jgi:2-iminobutanoate/2-iminopropanoate deaminase
VALSTWTPPAAVKRGRYVFTSSLNGAAANGSLDPSGEVQLQRAWAKLPEALASAGATLDDVVQVGVSIADHALRPYISPKWLELFPDARSRPARRTTAMRLPPGELAHIQATAVIGGGRRNIELPGVPHKDPLPGGAIVGNLLVSSAINGQVPNGAVREGVAAQIDQAYLNVRSLLAEAGASLDDIVHFWVFMKEELDIDTLVEKWLGVFPVDGDRPARKSFLRADLQGGQQVHMQLTALIGGGKRSNWEVPHVHHRDPIPMAARVGDLFMTSGVPGVKPDPDEHTPGGKPAEGLPDQLLYGFANLETMMKQQGGALQDVAHLGALVSNFDHLPALHDAIAQRWPDGRRPTLQLWGMPMPNDRMLVQLYGSAVL